MTASKVTNVVSYRFSQADRVFVDANVWLSLYGPAGWVRNRPRAYSAAFRSMREAGCGLFIDVLVLSEFINTCARIEHKRLQPHWGFKLFRQSPHFKPVAQAIQQDCARILKVCARVGTRFDLLDITALLQVFGLGSSDFNDQMIAETCRSNGFKLITDDADFQQSGLDILTANPKLLGQSPDV